MSLSRNIGYILLPVLSVLGGCDTKQESANTHTKANANTPNVSVPNGWSSKARGQIQALTRVYPQGEMTVFISPWINAKGKTAQQWVQAGQFMPPHGERVISTNHQINKSRIDTAHYVLRQLKPKNGKKRSSLMLACLRSGQVRTIDAFGVQSLFSGTNKAVFKDMILLSETACDDAQSSRARKRNRAAEQPGANTPKVEKGKRLKPPKFKKGKPPKKLEAVWSTAEWVVGINGMESKRSALVSFSDNTATDKLAYTFANGVRASKNKYPNRWGKSRIKKGDIEVKWKGAREYRDYYLTMKSRPGKNNERLNRCWSSSFFSTIGDASSYGGNTAYASNKWCFAKNGRFSNDSSVSISGSTGQSNVLSEVVFSGGSKGNKSGWYRIDGHVLQLVYDNGKSLTTSIGFVERKKTKDKYHALLLGSGYYD